MEKDITKLPMPVGIEGLINYNNFFHPNLCHVCKTSVQMKLKPCSDCHMISYCSEEHKILHEPQHKEICVAIGRMNQIRGLWNTRGKVWDEWLISRKNNMLGISQILRRKLQPYEEQMFMFPKSCLTCHQQSNLVATCEKCFSVNSCIDHNLHCVKHDCASLRLSLMLDISYLQQEKDIRSFSFCRHIDPSCFPYDMASFILKYTVEDKYQKPWFLFDYYYSDWVSQPLTMCQIVLDLKYQYLLYKTDLFIIHVIAVNRTDIYSWSAWEILLHLLYPGVTLKIIVIDANSSTLDVQNSQICNMCNSLKKSISIYYHGISYEDYVQKTPHERPDIIIGFHVDFKGFSQRTIRALHNQRCPLILTTTSQSKSDSNIRRLQDVLGVFEIKIFNSKNNFQSLRPYRDYENDGIFFCNQYLVICDSSGVSGDSACQQ